MSFSPEALVDRIYEAAVLPDVWSTVLDDMERVADGAIMSLLTRRSDAWTGWRHSPRAAPLHETWMRSPAATQSQTTARLLALNRAGWVAEHEVMTEAEYLADPLMASFGAVIGLHHAAATAILVPGGDLAVAQVWRAAGAPRFSAADLAKLDAFRPHMARSAMLSARWKLERLRAAAQALELLGIPAAVLDAAGCVLAANGLIQAMSAHVAWLPGNRLGLRDQGADGLLQRASEQARSTGAAPGRSFAAGGAGGAEPVVAHVVPLKGTGRELFEGGLILLALNPLGAGAPDTALLQGLFDLTAAEARVAAGLLDGLSVSALSDRHNVSLATVRSQVRMLLTKSGVTRQSEFIAKLRGLSAPPGA